MSVCLQYPEEDLPHLVWIDPKNVEKAPRDCPKVPMLVIPPPNRLHGSSHTVIYLHGNSCDIGNMAIELDYISRSLNATVIAPEYPGYGACQTPEYPRPPTGEAIDKHVELAYRFAVSPSKLANRPSDERSPAPPLETILSGLGQTPESVVLFGRSIGTGPACRLAAKLRCEEKTRIGGLVLHAPYTSIHDAVKDYSSAGLLFISNYWDVAADLKRLRDAQHTHPIESDQDRLLESALQREIEVQVHPLRDDLSSSAAKSASSATEGSEGGETEGQEEERNTRTRARVSASYALTGEPTPLLIVHGQDDEVIPIDHARKLCDIYLGPSTHEKCPPSCVAREPFLRDQRQDRAVKAAGALSFRCSELKLDPADLACPADPSLRPSALAISGRQMMVVQQAPIQPPPSFASCCTVTSNTRGGPGKLKALDSDEIFTDVRGPQVPSVGAGLGAAGSGGGAAGEGEGVAGSAPPACAPARAAPLLLPGEKEGEVQIKRPEILKIYKKKQLALLLPLTAKHNTYHWTYDVIKPLSIFLGFKTDNIDVYEAKGKGYRLVPITTTALSRSASVPKSRAVVDFAEGLWQHELEARKQQALEQAEKGGTARGSSVRTSV
uniref:AB hydrolase-1 domain-containing protein n=1 Tax=Chromera velia CCMP2878 TaxID=1169474 RepID=A0A0G4HGJ2_9ALVE|eukprot:Cvel_27372.t1-p1 / transcript=Cvel_27372.t1 / gene=Cvel_27372 / organism=Chromera_velia_CCMP2878 / gene_product=Alpha/beta hydrolase domain-containing protein 17A, putative / transcript_product=Alpha/beta hydrolase domain-containing protein 17A, putative / location=Cvel_scaffold3404:11501-14421(-) / protein_length=609 / sequence_SO=supercontig / SO=protein_coding / is_pseudo=false